MYTIPDVPLTDIEETQDLEYNTTGNSSFSEYEENTSTPQQFTQAELNELVLDLNLSKQASELLASRLKEKNCLKLGTKIAVFRSREVTLVLYLIGNENIVYCNNIPRLVLQIEVEFRPVDWRLFITVRL